MALNRIPLKDAQKIIDLYSYLMENTTGILNYKYSDMKGYDVYDIDNSLKLIIAFRVYYPSELDSARIKELKEFAAWAQNGPYLFHMNFVPDDIYNELSKYEYQSPNWIIATNRLLHDGEYISKDYHELIDKNLETMESFLNFCIENYKNTSTYWARIYSRLNLVYIVNDEEYIPENDNLSTK